MDFEALVRNIELNSVSIEALEEGSPYSIQRSPPVSWNEVAANIGLQVVQQSSHRGQRDKPHARLISSIIMSPT